MLEKIVSGGQTGADRAALDWAIRHGVPHGGWCPKGRLAEDGVIDARYCLTETPSRYPVQRTRWNVRDSDATVIFSLTTALSGGSLLTAQCAQLYHKPLLHLSRDAVPESPARALAGFLHTHQVGVLNVAGPRASGEPGVGAFVTAVLDALHELCSAAP